MTTTVIVDACRFISKLKCTFDRARLFRALVIRIFPSQVSLRRMFWLNFVQPRKNIGKPDTGQRLLKAFPKSRWLEPDEWAGRVLVALVEDGRLLHDFFLAEVKAPSESTAPWDYYKIRRIIPAEEAAQPLAQFTGRST